MMLLSTWAAKNRLPFITLMQNAVQKTLPSATLQGKMWIIDETSPALNDWLHTNYPQVFTTISRSDFLTRFTDQEKLAVASNPQSLVFWLNLLEVQTVNLTDPTILEGMNSLVILGVITSERKTVILTT